MLQTLSGWLQEGDVLATLALNTFRHLEIYYGVSGMGGIVHTLNFRLHPDQAKYIINHAEDKIIFLEDHLFQYWRH
ncbi:MAG: hypothetical protein CM15mP104_0430 [Gammaproteobacteria bacterium]|nr:MAG: hypothetical protein CM15mP104_0430 [Gammaproteobacteria bacterium]